MYLSRVFIAFTESIREWDLFLSGFQSIGFALVFRCVVLIGENTESAFDVDMDSFDEMYQRKLYPLPSLQSRNFVLRKYEQVSQDIVSGRLPVDDADVAIQLASRHVWIDTKRTHTSGINEPSIAVKENTLSSFFPFALLQRCVPEECSEELLRWRAV